MRIFVWMDVSVYQHKKKFQFYINELTRSHQTSLFMQWGSGNMDLGLQDMANILHFVTHTDMVDRQ